MSRVAALPAGVAAVALVVVGLIEIAAEDGGGGERVAAGFLLLVGEAGLGHLPVCFGGGEAFVERFERWGETRGCKRAAQMVGEGEDEFGPRTGRAVHVEGQAQDDGVGFLLADDADEVGGECVGVEGVVPLAAAIRNGGAERLMDGGEGGDDARDAV